MARALAWALRRTRVRRLELTLGERRLNSSGRSDCRHRGGRSGSGGRGWCLRLTRACFAN